MTSLCTLLSGAPYACHALHRRPDAYHRRRLDIARRVLFGLEAAKRGNQEMIPAAERIKELLGPLEATKD